MIIIGVILLIAGVAGFISSGPKMDMMRSGIGQMAMAFNQSASQEASMWQIIYYLSIAAIIIGAILIIAGAVKTKKT